MCRNEIRMKNIKMIISYDGSRYNGWQKQGNTQNTLQEKMEETLKKLLDEEIEVMASGRTDAGANAIGQVINFHTKSSLDTEELMDNLNKYLPKDIRVLSAEAVNGRFHSRLNAVEKHYMYRIDNGRVANIFERKYMYRIEEKLELDKMKKACRLLEGEHDFAAFCANKKMKKSTVRNISKIVIEEKNGIINIHFYGNGFLYNMVRIMTGTLIEIGMGKKDVEKITEIINSKERANAGFLAPSNALFLMEVTY